MRGAFDRAALELVSAAYRVHGSMAAWLRTILEAATPLLRPDTGLIGTTFRVFPDGRIFFSSDLVRTDDVPPEAVEFMRGLGGEHTPPHVHAATLDRAPLDTASAAYRRFYGADFADWDFVQGWRDLGLHDQLVAKAYDPTGAGCHILAQMRHVTAQPTKHVQEWNHVLTHVLAGMRLQMDLAALSTNQEAVITPEGRVLHAEDAAKPLACREALRGAALRMDRARTGAGKADAGRALREWHALVAGRWSLLDSFESDGRRYLVARRNDPRLGFPRALSQRERQVAAYAARGHSNKFIAYALGLAPSTVSSHLTAAMRRLGARHRGDLAALLSLECGDS
jgi:DNA-binding CsgD family transcriptional regulator